VAQVVVGELLVRSLYVHAGEQVLDVAGGAGNTALAAAWERVRFLRGCRVWPSSRS
jgi:ubiquinone/menaquinone biosynthesis C-methylase UbiE